MYSTIKKKILNFVRSRSNDVFHVIHQKGLIFLTRLRLGLSQLREHKFKHTFLDTLNPICTCGFDIEILNHLFLHCPRFTNGRQNLLLKIERIIPDMSGKTDASITSILLYGGPSFSAELKLTHSVHLLTTYYPQKGLNLLSLQRLDSYLRSSKF